MGQLIPEATTQKTVGVFNIVAERTSDLTFLRTPLSNIRDPNYEYFLFFAERGEEKRDRKRERTSRARIQDKTGR
jgi:hypothetical protein